jgi:hypothetical protein
VEFKKENRINKRDELWMVIDIDRWTARELSEVARICTQKGFWLAASNPCFELWLFLHLSDVQNPAELSSCTLVEDRLRDKLGGYNKKNIDCGAFLPYVTDAVSRAESMDNQPETRWPNSPGTRVYRIIKILLS